MTRTGGVTLPDGTVVEVDAGGTVVAVGDAGMVAEGGSVAGTVADGDGVRADVVAAGTLVFVAISTEVGVESVLIAVAVDCAGTSTVFSDDTSPVGVFSFAIAVAEVRLVC